MNYKKLVNTVAKETEKEYQVCINVIDAYEKYCTDVIKCPFKKEIDASMVEWISQLTKYDIESVKQILNSLITIVRDEVKNKVLFIK